MGYHMSVFTGGLSAEGGGAAEIHPAGTAAGEAEDGNCAERDAAGHRAS